MEKINLFYTPCQGIVGVDSQKLFVGLQQHGFKHSYMDFFFSGNVKQYFTDLLAFCQVCHLLINIDSIQFRNHGSSKDLLIKVLRSGFLKVCKCFRKQIFTPFKVYPIKYGKARVMFLLIGNLFLLRIAVLFTENINQHNRVLELIKIY